MDNFKEYELAAAYKAATQTANSNPNLAPYEEPYKAETTVKIQNVWMDAEFIPASAPAPSTLDPDGFFLVQAFGEAIPIIRKVTAPLELVDGTRGTLKSDLLRNALPYDFGDGSYQYELRDTAGHVVPFGLNRWEVDGRAGTLCFLGGMPAGYASEFTLTFWRYCGRVGPDRLLFNDGTTKMVAGYVPQYPKSLADKEYVDVNIANLTSQIHILTPEAPSTFEGVSLKVLSPVIPSEYLIDNVPWPVVFSDKSVTLDVPTFYDEGFGTVALMVNDVAIDTFSLTEPHDAGVIGRKGLFKVSESGYLDDIRVYKKMKMTVDFMQSDLPYTVTDRARLTIRLRHSFGQAEYFSASTEVGVENVKVLDSDTFGKINMTTIKDLVSAGSWVSGVPALSSGDTFTFTCSAFAYGAFKRNELPMIKARLPALGIDYEVWPDPVYAELSPTQALTKAITIPAGQVSEKIDFELGCVKLDGSDHLTVGGEYPLRVDSISDESKRLTSGSGMFPLSFGAPYDSKESLLVNSELQLLGGRYRWPAGNYTANGVFVNQAVENVLQPIGPDYDLIPSEGVRWVTLHGDVPVCNGVTISFLGLDGAVEDKDTHAFLNVMVFAKVLNKTPWMNVNGCFNGVTAPTRDGDPCLVVSLSSLTEKRITFGKTALGGTLVVRIGITKASNVTLTGVSIAS